MANAHELARGHARLRALIEFALDEGWHVKRTRGGHLMFTKPGCAVIYTSSTASDHRARACHQSTPLQLKATAPAASKGDASKGDE